MTFKNKFPIKKSIKDIEFYLEHGPKFGTVIKFLRERLISGMFLYPSEIIDAFELFCNKKWPNQEKYFPFSLQNNIDGVQFGNTLCISVNDVVAHGRTNEKFKDGDVISIDCGLAIKKENNNNYLHFDAAFTAVIGKEPNWINTPWIALKNIIEEQPQDIYELGSIIENTCNKFNLSNIISLSGHGIGYDLHEPPYIHNAKGDYLKEEIFERLCFCAEPIFANRKDENKLIERTCIDSDGWAILTQSGVPTSHFETMFCKHEGQIIDLLEMTKWSL